MWSASPAPQCWLVVWSQHGRRERGKLPFCLLAALHAGPPLGTDWWSPSRGRRDKGVATILYIDLHATLPAGTSHSTPPRGEGLWGQAAAVRTTGLHWGASIIFLLRFFLSRFHEQSLDFTVSAKLQIEQTPSNGVKSRTKQQSQLTHGHVT